MSIIFNERLYIEKLLDGYPVIDKIDDIQPTKYFDWKDCFLLAKYYREIENLKPRKIRDKILEYITNNKIYYNEVKLGDALDRAIKKSKFQKLRVVEQVEVRQKEIDTIRSIKNFNLERILFVMLVLAKAVKQTSTYDGKDLILTWKFSNILRQAKLYINRSEADQYKNKLHNLNMIFSLEPGRRKLQKGMESFKILFAEMEEPLSPIYTTITNLDNIISFYDFHCLDCDKIIEQTSNNKKYCKDCAEKRKWHRK